MSEATRHPTSAVSGDEIISEINRTHAVVLYGSRPVVLREQPEAHAADRVKLMTFESFRALYLNKNSLISWTNPVTGETKQHRVNHANYWLGHAARREFKGIEFHPDPYDAEGTPGYYNLWRGFSVKPDVEAPPELRYKKYKTFLDHLRVNVASDNESHFAWLWAWMAHTVQKPRERPGTAVVLRGAMGVGKSIAGEVLGSLFEQHYFQVDDARYLTGNFNSHMSGCVLLQVDEGVWAGDKSAEGRLKGLVSGATQMIEAKGLDPVKMPNYVRLWFTSNEGWVIPAGQDERRFAVFDVAAHAKLNFGYFAEMRSELDSGGREALLADLLAFDLSAASVPNLRVIPKTQALLEQKINSFDPVQGWWYARLNEGAPTKRARHWLRCVAVQSLYNDYVRTSEATGVRRRADETAFGISMRKYVPGLFKRRVSTEVEEWGDDGSVEVVERRAGCYVLPSLNECRAAFERRLEQIINWDDPVCESDGASGSAVAKDEDGT